MSKLGKNNTVNSMFKRENLIHDSNFNHVFSPLSLTRDFPENNYKRDYIINLQQIRWVHTFSYYINN